MSLDSPAIGVVWIAPEVTLEVSPTGETPEHGNCPEPPGDNPSFPGERFPGVSIPSSTMVTGGGTIKLKVASPAAEGSQGGFLLKVAGTQRVTITGITLDNNNSELQCDTYPSTSLTGPQCEHRHAIGTWDAEDLTVTHCNLRNLVGDGVYLGSSVGHEVKRVLIQYNTFHADPLHPNRNGISFGRGTDVSIIGNTFEGMARWPMPGAIDLESECPEDVIERVRIADNEILGRPILFSFPDNPSEPPEPGEEMYGENGRLPDPQPPPTLDPNVTCAQHGIALGNNGGGLFQSILIENNVVHGDRTHDGCYGDGILVHGSGTLCGPVIVKNNWIETTRAPEGLPNHCDEASSERACYRGIRVEGANTRGPGPQSGCIATACDGISPPSCCAEDGRCCDHAGFPPCHRVTYAHVEGNAIIAAGDGPSMGGITVATSRAYVTGNHIEDAQQWGVATSAFFAGGGFADELRKVCGNHLFNVGDPAQPYLSTGAIKVEGKGTIVKANDVHAAPLGVSVVGSSLHPVLADVFDNLFDDVASCGSAFGCIACSNGAQRGDISGNQPNTTNCIPPP